jgi:hypothetical protein
VINLVTAGLNRLTVNRDGSTTLAGALSGTSATFSSTGNAVTITSSSSASNVQLKVNNGVNGDIYAGVAASDGSSVFTGTTAYSGYIGTNISVPFYIAAGGTVRLTIASTGAATFSGQVKIPASSYLEWNSRGGIAQDGSFNFNWSTNGVANAFHLQSSTGNVGIGTTSPVGTLHISNASPIFNIDDTSTTGTLKRFRLTSGDIGTTQTALFSFSNSDATSTGNTNVMVLNELGNVGIGTTSPLQTLTLAGTQMMYNTGGDGVSNVVIGSITSQVRNYGTGIATSSFASIQFATDPTTWYKGDIRFLTNGTDGTSGAGTERMRITSGGNVEIGGSAQNVSALTPKFQVVTNVSADRNNGLVYFANDANSSILSFAKSRSGTIGTLTYPGGSDFLGRIFFTGANEAISRFDVNGDISMVCGSTWSASNRETKLEITGTPNGATGRQINLILAGNGDLTITGSNATKASGTAWINPSDLRLKTNIRPYNKGLAEVLKIEPKLWNFNQDSGFDQNKEHLSVIAQEIQDFMPEIVSSYKGKLNGKETELLTIDASDITWLLVKAIQEQQSQIEALKLLIK